MKVVSSPVRVERLLPPPGLTWWQRWTWVQLWRVLEDVRIEIGEPGSANYHRLVVNAGEIVDFASIPKPVKWLFPDRLVYGVGALFHDQGYRQGLIGKRILDALLAGLALDCDGATEFEAEIIFLGVHLGGFAAWRRHRNQPLPQS